MNINKIIKKKPYSFINKDFVKKISKLIKAKTEKEKIKLVRAKLRKISTSALPLKFYKKFKTLPFSKEILKMHRSTNERAELYGWLINEIKERGNKVVDLGCGFNIIAFYYNDFIPQSYVGYDIDCAVIKFLERFIKEKKINAKVSCQDISKISFPKADIYLCLKLFDALEDVEWDVTKKIMARIIKKSRYILVSFSKVSLSGKGKLREREWFERILHDLNTNFKKEIKNNEIFYFIWA